VTEHHGVIENLEFDAQVLMITRFPVDSFPAFAKAVTELSAGQVQPIVLESDV
jgi:hypothetical protein